MRAASSRATLPSLTSSATTNMVVEAMVLTPTARPSSPSIRLTLLVMPTIHSMVTGTASQPRISNSLSEKILGLLKNSMTTPWATAIIAAAIWTSSFIHARRLTTSSIAPQATISTAPSRMPRTWRVISTKSTTLKRKPRNMARPPMRGIGWSWTRRLPSGTSMAPIFCAKALTTGVAAKPDCKSYGYGEQYPDPQLGVVQHILTYTPKRLPRAAHCDLKLGDAVRPAEGPYGALVDYFATKPSFLYTLRRVRLAT